MTKNAALIPSIIDFRTAYISTHTHTHTHTHSKDSAAVERYNSLVKEGKEDEYKSDLSVKELQELVEDLGY